MRACVRVCVRACVRVYVCVSVRAYVRACVRVCVCVCIWIGGDGSLHCMSEIVTLLNLTLFVYNFYTWLIVMF